MTIKKKLPLMISLLVASVLIVTSGLVYYFQLNSAKETNGQNLLTVAKEEKKLISSLLDGDRKQLELLAQSKQIIEVAKLREQHPGDDFFALTNLEIQQANQLLDTEFKKLKDHEHFFLLDSNGISILDTNKATLKVLNVSSRDYFKRGLKGEFNISNTLLSKTTGRIVFALATPVRDENNRVIAVMASGVFVDYFTNYLKQMKIGQTGYMYMTDSVGTILSHPNEELLNKPSGDATIEGIIGRLKNGQTVNADTAEYEFDGIKKIQAYDIVPESNWVLSATTTVNEMQQDATAFLKIIVVITLLAILAATALGIIISRKITTPLGDLQSLMAKAADGDLTVKSNIQSKDELSHLSNSFNAMTEKIRELTNKINSSISIVACTVDTITAASETTGESINEVSKTVQQIALGASTQSENIQDVVGKLEKVGDEIENLDTYSGEMKSNTDAVLKVNESSKVIVKQLLEKTNENHKAVEKVSEIMDELKNSSSNVGVILESISSISEQTNLLALNAAIEAARAGDAGKGFAIVAEEVRKLAEQSSESAGKIGAIINDIQNKTKEAVNIVATVENVVKEQNSVVSETEETFKEISKNIDSIAKKVEHMNKSIKNINKDKEEVIEEMHSISSVSEETAASSEEVSAATEEQSASMEELSNFVLNLSSTVEELSQGVKMFKL